MVRDSCPEDCGECVDPPENDPPPTTTPTPTCPPWQWPGDGSVPTPTNIQCGTSVSQECVLTNGSGDCTCLGNAETIQGSQCPQKQVCGATGCAPCDWSWHLIGHQPSSEEVDCGDTEQAECYSSGAAISCPSSYCPAGQPTVIGQCP